MAEAILEEETNLTADKDSAEFRVYEVGYHILSTVKEDDIEGVVAEIRSFIEKAGGSFIAEGAPVSMKLAYTMYVNNGGKRFPYDRASFGWIKFEVDGATANALATELEKNPNILRSLVFKTTREDNRAAARSSVLREVKRGDTIKSQPAKGAGAAVAGEVSEEELDKSIDEITKE